MISVTLYADSNGTHLHQIYTGLYLLYREGIIKLRLRPGISLTKSRKNRQFIAIKVETSEVSRIAVFDMADYQQLGLPNAISSCDLYFKRSLTEQSYEGLSGTSKQKLQPFGFNYQVITPSMALLAKRLFLEYWSRPYNPLKKKNRFHLHNIKELFDANLGRSRSPLLSVDDLKPKNKEYDVGVLFQCRLWDPSDLDPKNYLDSDKVNSDRIEIVRSLKENLGDNFIGGLQPTEYARRVAPELVISLEKMSMRRNYLSMVERSSVVVSTVGLLGSNGWKLGEYVALGKAIVSEPIMTELPGKFEEGVHYEAYRSPEECIDKVKSLLADPERIRALSKATSDYYEEYLCPRRLMWRHLNTILS